MATLPATEIEVTLGQPPFTVEIGAAAAIEIDLGNRGPVGATGPTGPSAADWVLVADGSIGGNRCVFAHDADEASYFDKDITNLAYKATGFSKNAANDGDDVVVQIAGPLDGFSGLTVGVPYYASTAGNITPTPPTTGLLVPVGYAVNATTLFIHIGPTFQL